MNPIELPHPSDLSACERAAQITVILAAAIVRSQLALAEECEKVRLGLSPDQSVHVTPYQEELS